MIQESSNENLERTIGTANGCRIILEYTSLLTWERTLVLIRRLRPLNVDSPQMGMA